MANLAQSINVLQAVILTNKEKMILTPTYHVMEMYNVHQDATLIPVELSSPSYVSGSDSLAAVSVAASKDKNGDTHISLVNIHPGQAQQITLTINGAAYKSVTGRILVSPRLDDHNSFEEPKK